MHVWQGTFCLLLLMGSHRFLFKLYLIFDSFNVLFCLLGVEEMVSHLCYHL